MQAHIVTAHSVGLADYSANVGRAVYNSGVDAAGEPEVTLATDPTADTQEPYGVIDSADEDGNVTVNRGGPGKGVAGAAITPGTDQFLSWDGTGQLVATTAGDYWVAVFDGGVVAANDEIIDIIVTLGQLET